MSSPSFSVGIVERDKYAIARENRRERGEAKSGGRREVDWTKCIFFPPRVNFFRVAIFTRARVFPLRGYLLSTATLELANYAIKNEMYS